MASCLLLLTAQLMTAGDLNAQFDRHKLDHGTENLLYMFRNGTGCYCLFCEDKRVSRKH